MSVYEVTGEPLAGKIALATVTSRPGDTLLQTVARRGSTAAAAVYRNTCGSHF